MLEIPVSGNMIGSGGRLSQNNGDTAFRRPPQMRIELSYINIQNTTENTLKIYALTDDTSSTSPTYEIGGRMTISLKLTQRLYEGVIITFNNPNPTTLNDVKPLEVIWSEGSKGWGNSLAPSFSTSYTGSSVNVINTPNVNVANTPTVTFDTTKFSNDYVDTPMTALSANVATTLTQSGVAGKSWYLCYVNWRVSGTAVVGATNLALTIKDGTTIIYQSAIPSASTNGTNLSITFPQPIKITQGNSFTYSIASPNNNGCIIYANIGAFNK
jgi:hypothetical protein